MTDRAKIGSDERATKSFNGAKSGALPGFASFAQTRTANCSIVPFYLQEQLF